MSRSTARALAAGLVALTASICPQPTDAARIEVLAWTDSLVPPPFAGTDDPRATAAFLPDTLRARQRPELATSFVDPIPTIDGNLEDWPVVRWREARGNASVVRGRWSGSGDASMRFALLWSTRGLVLGAEVHDDSLRVDAAGTNSQRVESVLLYVGTSSAPVTRYWRGAERAFRVWADGRLEAWTRQHNRRVVLFDPTALGVRGAAQVSAQSGLAGRIDVELWVPWDALFPALPHPGAAMLGNVLFEDLDAEAGKLIAWSTRMESSSREHAWASLAFRGGPQPGTWLASVGSRHSEPGHPYEWSLLRWGGAAALEAGLRLTPAAGAAALHKFKLEHAAQLVRVHELPEARLPWRDARRLEMQIGSEDALWRDEVVYSAPTVASVDSGLAEIETMPGRGRTFPARADVAIRLQDVGAALHEFHDWFLVRHRPDGILATRAALWDALETQVAEAQLLRDALAADTDPQALQQRLAARWPRRNAAGHPMGQAVLRGHRSALDGSTQPYVMYHPAKMAGPTAPLVVVLHALGEDASRPFAGETLTRELEARGWMGVAPYGRGDTGFVLAGERDVLEVIEGVRQQFPVDAKRIFVTGYEMGGTGTWLLSLRHAELFAAATIVSGYGDMDQPGLFESLAYRPEELFYYETQNPSRLVRSELKTAYRVVHAEGDRRISVVHARIMEDRLREFEVPNTLVIEPGERNGRALFLATLHDSFDYMAKYRRATPGRSNGEWFGGVGGPVATVFPRGPFAVVFGTRALPEGSPTVGAERRGGLSLTGPEADARTADQFAQQWQALFSGWPRVIAADDATLELQETHNLVIVGDPRTHRLLDESRAALPVGYSGDHFEIDGQTYDFATAGILYAMASPTTPGRTWVVLSGMGERLGGVGKSLLKLGADYAILNDQREFLAVGHFRGLGSLSPQLGTGARKPR